MSAAVASVTSTESAFNPYDPYRRALLAPQRIRELSTLRPSRAVLDALISWLQILLAWGAVALWPRWWVVALAIPVVGTRFYALFLIGHDGLHRRVFPLPRTNDLFCDLFIFGPIGAITRLNNGNHLAHHQYLATPADTDRYKHACFNKTTRLELLFFLTGLASVLPAVRNVFGGRKREAAAPNRDGYKPRDVLILLGWQASLVVGLSWAIGWWAYPVLWLAPAYVFCFGGDLARSFIEHSHTEADALADRHRLVSFDVPWFERVFFSPVNMNYHAVHHLWPSIPYYNLPTADRQIRDRAEAAGLEWRSSYVSYLLRYMKALPIPGCRT